MKIIAKVFIKIKKENGSCTQSAFPIFLFMAHSAADKQTYSPWAHRFFTWITMKR